MDRARRSLSPGRIYVALVLAAACLLAGCGLAAAHKQTGDAGGAASAEETVDLERTANAGTPERPNIILILTDDLSVQDLNAESLSHMPNLRSLLVERGTTFKNAFVTDSLCCPSRATILRGQYPHNHLIEGNEWPQGGARRFHALGRQKSTIATWLQSEGYRTVLIGKYMNDYEGTYVPPGWDDWYAVSGNYMSNDLNENGHIVSYDPGKAHLDDVLAEKAADYIRHPGGGALSFFRPHKPFFMWLGTKAPHAPADPAPRYQNTFPKASLPHPPSFDETNVSDKPRWIRDNPPLGPQEITFAQSLYRKRLQSMLSVDDMIGELLKALRKSGELENTYIFFTSDNGFHLGTHRLSAGKWTAYEEDIRVPLIVRGPGVPKGRVLHQLVLNNDLAPTFAELGGAEVPPFVEGRTLVPLLRDNPPPPDHWRQAFLVESIAESAEIPSSVVANAPPRLLTGDTQPSEDWRRASPLQKSSIKDVGRPAFKAIRTKDRLYVEYATGESELYNLHKDPYELTNVYEDTKFKRLWQLQAWLNALRDCAAEECRAAEDGHY